MTGKSIRCLFLCLVLLAVFPAASGADQTYKVRRGDSLSRIAKRFHVKASSIAEANNLSSDELKPGDRLIIPTAGARPKISSRRSPAIPSSADVPRAARGPSPQTAYHTIEKGDTLSSIAARYGMSVRELKKLNGIRKAKRLKVGAKLLVRESAPEETPEKPADAATETARSETPEGTREEMPPRTIATESQLARELKALADSPVVREVREISEPPAAGKGTLGSVKEKLVLIARKMLDIPYRFGGSSFLGIDCSGYVQKVFGVLDIVLPRTAREQFNLGKVVGREDLSIGDLVFFKTYAKFPSHVGIYLGDNRFIHASAKDRKVKIDSLDAPYYIKRFVGARRLPLEEPAGEI